MKKTFQFIILVALMIWPILYFINKNNNRKIQFKLEQVARKDIRNYIICSGIILPKKKVEIKSNLSGTLDSIHVKVGDSVKKNQLIGTIKVIPRLEELISSNSRINSAKIIFEREETNYKRSKILLEKGVISQSNFESIEADYRNAKEDLNRRKKEYNVLKTGNTLNSKTSNTAILSTIDGVVTQLPIKKGSTIIQSNNFNDGSTIAEISDMNEMIFDGYVKEYEITKLKVGMPVVLTTALNKNEETGYISEISISGEKKDGIILFNIKVRFKNSKIKQTGYSANAKILVEERKQPLVVKEEWLSFQNDSIFVDTDVDGEIEKKHITVGISDGEYIEVISGLNSNDLIRVYDF